MKNVNYSIAYCFIFLLASFELAAEENDNSWPQWRGSNRDSQVAGDWPSALDESKLKPLWTKPFGPSYSGPIIYGDTVFVTETKNKQEEVVTALDTETGDQKWTARWPGAMRVPMFAAKNGSWIRATPATDGKRLYVAGMLGRFVCLDAKTGKEIWHVDFSERYGVPREDFGHVCSPLIINNDDKLDNAIYIQCSAGFLKMNRLNGEEIWRTLNGGQGMMSAGAFSSPCVATLSGKKQLLVQTRMELAGVEIENGSVLWRTEVPNFRGMNILTPSAYGDTVFTSSYNNQSFGYNISKTEQTFSVGQKWTAPSKAYMSSPVIVGDNAFVHLQSKRVACLNLNSGETRWVSKARFGAYWSMVANNDQILALDSRGILYLFKSNPEKLEIVGEAKLATDDSWAHLAITGNRIFVRGIDSLTAYEWVQ